MLHSKDCHLFAIEMRLPMSRYGDRGLILSGFYSAFQSFACILLNCNLFFLCSSISTMHHQRDHNGLKPIHKATKLRIDAHLPFPNDEVSWVYFEGKLLWYREFASVRANSDEIPTASIHISTFVGVLKYRNNSLAAQSPSKMIHFNIRSKDYSFLTYMVSFPGTACFDQVSRLQAMALSMGANGFNFPETSKRRNYLSPI